MRSTTAQQDTDLQALAYGVHAIVEVQNGSGTWIDLTDLSGFDWLVSAEVSEDVDRPIIAATVRVVRDREGTDSLAPLREDSPLNVDDLSAYSPLLDPGRGLGISVAVVGAGVTPAAGDFEQIFLGTIDKVAWGTDPIVVTARDQIGAELADSFIEDRTRYATGGVALETVIQNILDDWLPTPTTLLVPTPPGFTISPYDADRISVLQAITQLASLIGWVVRVRWDDGGSNWRLVLEEPDRTASVPSWTFGPEDYFDVSGLDINRLPIRNRVKVYYYDGSGRQSVEVSDASSESRYGSRFLRIHEPPSSPIDTSGEATTMAQAALDDLKEPDATQEVEARLFWPVQIRDLLRFTANGVHYSTDQDLAVFGYRHVLKGGSGSTFLKVRGQPAGLYRMWQQLSVQAEPEDATVTETRYSNKEPIFEPIPGPRPSDGQPGYTMDIHYDLGPEATGFRVGINYFNGIAFGWTYGVAATGEGTHRIQNSGQTADHYFLQGDTDEEVSLTPTSGSPVGQPPEGKQHRWVAADQIGDSGLWGIRISDGTIRQADRLELDTSSFAITMVSGRPRLDFTGSPGPHTLDSHTDVTVTSIAAGELLVWDGAAWINNTLAEAGIAAAGHTHDAADVASGTFADARIAQSNVTQHQAALSIGAGQVTAGTFAAGDFVFPSDLSVTGILAAGTTAVPANLAAGDVFASGGVFAVAEAVGDIDHLWHEDATQPGNIQGAWHFVSDAARLATGNSLLRAAAIRVDDGGAANPSVRVGADNHGMYHAAGSAALALVYGGADIVAVTATRVEFTQPLRTLDGTAGAPTHSFVNHSDQGMYAVAAGTLGLAAGGVLHLEVDNVDPDEGRVRVRSAQFGVEEEATAVGTTADWDQGNVLQRTNTGTITFDIGDATMLDGHTYVLLVRDETGAAATWTWTGTGLLWRNGLEPEFPQVVGDVTRIDFIKSTHGVIADWSNYS